MRLSNASQNRLQDPKCIDLILELMQPQHKVEMEATKLFICCPMAHVEPIISKHFTGEHYFLSALGGIFDKQDADYLNYVDQLITAQGIEDIYLLQNLSCPFLKSALGQNVKAKTEVEQSLRELYLQHQELFLPQQAFADKCQTLAQLNLYHQIQGLNSFLLEYHPMKYHRFTLHAYAYQPSDRSLGKISF